jgi:chromosome segregation ATPase
VHGKDSNLIAIVIASVRKELNQEAATLENIATLHREFNTRKLSIEPWLDKPPTFSHVQENRKQVKSLRSKLRHLQADKQDLEEVLILIFTYTLYHFKAKFAGCIVPV